MCDEHVPKNNMCDEHLPKKLKTSSPTSYTFHGLLQKLENNDIDIRDYHFNIIRKANHKVTPDVITNPYPISIVYSDNTSTIIPLDLIPMFGNNTTGPTYMRLGFEHDFFPTLFKPSDRPTETVVYPSPAGVGVIAVTKISFPSFLLLSFSR